MTYALWLWWLLAVSYICKLISLYLSRWLTSMLRQPTLNLSSNKIPPAERFDYLKNLQSTQGGFTSTNIQFMMLLTAIVKCNVLFKIDSDFYGKLFSVWSRSVDLLSVRLYSTVHVALLSTGTGASTLFVHSLLSQRLYVMFNRNFDSVVKDRESKESSLH